jgi:hypothetical protein
MVVKIGGAYYRRVKGIRKKSIIYYTPFGRIFPLYKICILRQTGATPQNTDAEQRKSGFLCGRNR